METTGSGVRSAALGRSAGSSRRSNPRDRATCSSCGAPPSGSNDH